MNLSLRNLEFRVRLNTDKMYPTTSAANLRLRDKAGNFTTQPLIVPLPPRVPKQ